ncbi:MAG: hypothetical protein HY904_16470 [Deltaproteobacteria bacterium]|nr:hypothetical protein [Deltaproteobacteria bacterium]
MLMPILGLAGCYAVLPPWLGNLLNTFHPGNWPPAILKGQDLFKRTPVPNEAAGPRGVFDKGRGLEIAHFTDTEIEFLDPTTFDVRERVPFSGVPCFGYNRPAGLRPCDLISIRSDGVLNFMAGRSVGGDDVGLADVNGEEVWRFQPTPGAHADRMIAVDLDADGEKEFYAITMDALFRLDSTGRVVWRVSTPAFNWSLDWMPSYQDRPPAVVTEAGLWNARGNLVQEMRIRDPYSVKVVRWNAHPCLAHVTDSGSGVHIHEVNGSLQSQGEIGPFAVNEIFTVRLKPDAPEWVVVRGFTHWVKHGELSIFNHDGALVYREIRTGR